MPGKHLPLFLLSLASTTLAVRPLSAELMPRSELHSDLSLKWSSFTVTSTASEVVGPVTITGKQGSLGTGLVSFTVKVFGRKHQFSQAQLDKLKYVVINGMQVFYAPDEKPGKRKLYIRLSSAFISDFRERRLITITDNGEVTIEDQPPPWRSSSPPPEDVQQGVGPDGRSPAAPARRSTP